MKISFLDIKAINPFATYKNPDISPDVVSNVNADADINLYEHLQVITDIAGANVEASDSDLTVTSEKPIENLELNLKRESAAALSESLGSLKLSHTKQKGDCLYLYSQDSQVGCAMEILEAIALSTQDLENSILFTEGIRRLKLHGDAWALGVELPIAQSAIVAGEIIAALLRSLRQDSKLAETKLKLLLQNNCLNLLCETRIAILQAEIALPMLDVLRTLRSSDYFQSVTVSHRLVGQMGDQISKPKPSWSFEIDLLAIGIESNTPAISPITEEENLSSESLAENIQPSRWQKFGEYLTTYVGAPLIGIGKVCIEFKWLGKSTQDISPVTAIPYNSLSISTCAISLAIGLGTTVALDRTLHEYAQTNLLSKITVAEPPENPDKKDIKNKPALNFNIARFNEKLALLDWKTTTRKRAPEILIVGSSRALRGVEPSTLEKALFNRGYKNLSVFNLGLDGATAKVVNLQITEILSHPQLPRMIIWADGLRAFNSSRSDITYDEITASSGYKQLQKTLKDKEVNPDLPVINKDVNSTVSSPINQVLSSIFSTATKRQDVRNSVVKSFDHNTHLLSNSEAIIAATSPNTAAAIDKQGFVAFDVTFDPKTYFLQHPQVPGDYDLDYRNFDITGSQFEAFNNIVDFCRRNNIQLLLVNMPLHSTYLDPIRTRYEATFNDRMQELSQREGFTYLDMSQSIPNQSELFSDPSHLNKQGAIAIAQMLAQNPKIPWQALKF